MAQIIVDGEAWSSEPQHCFDCQATVVFDADDVYAAQDRYGDWDYTVRCPSCGASWPIREMLPFRVAADARARGKDPAR